MEGSPFSSLLELYPDDPEFWSQNFSDLVEADLNFQASALFTMNSPSIKDMKFFAITEGSSLVFKQVLHFPFLILVCGWERETKMRWWLGSSSFSLFLSAAQKSATISWSLLKEPTKSSAVYSHGPKSPLISSTAYSRVSVVFRAEKQWRSTQKLGELEPIQSPRFSKSEIMRMGCSTR